MSLDEVFPPLAAAFILVLTVPAVSSALIAMVLYFVPTSRWLRRLERESAIYGQMPLGAERDQIGVNVENLAALLNDYRSPEKGKVWRFLRWVPVALTVVYVGLVGVYVATNGWVTDTSVVVVTIVGLSVGVSFTTFALATGFAEPGKKVTARQVVASTAQTAPAGKPGGDQSYQPPEEAKVQSPAVEVSDAWHIAGFVVARVRKR